MTNPRLDLSRSQILAFRRGVGELEARLPNGPASLRRAAWAGLQDSMPRAALLSIHARVDGIGPTALEDPSLVQLWGPRYSVFVVAARDIAVFTLGTMPDDARGQRRARDLADRIHAHIGSESVSYAEVGRALGVHPNSLRYASATGTVLIRWEGARRPTIRSVPPPAVDPGAARLELARRHLHIYGPATADSFARWAGIRPSSVAATFDLLGQSLVPVRTPVGDGWILAGDEPAFRTGARGVAAARLLPSGDPYILLHGAERELMLPDPIHRRALWTARVWPGAVMVDGQVVGTWRRAEATVRVQPWRRLSPAARRAVETEAEAMPLPGVQGSISVLWEDL